MIPPINFCGGPPVNYRSQPDDDDVSPMSSTRGRSPTFKPCTSAIASAFSAVPSRSPCLLEDNDRPRGISTSRPSCPSSGASPSPLPSGTEDGEAQSSTPCASNSTDLEPFPDFDSNEPFPDLDISEPNLPPTPPATPPLNPLPTPPPTPPRNPQQPSSSSSSSSSDVSPPRVIKLELWPPSPLGNSAGPQQASSPDCRSVGVGGVEEVAASFTSRPPPSANPQEPQLRVFGLDRIPGRIGRVDKDYDKSLSVHVGCICKYPLPASLVPRQPWLPFASRSLLPPNSRDPTHPFIARAKCSLARRRSAPARTSTTTHTPTATPRPTSTEQTKTANVNASITPDLASEPEASPSRPGASASTSTSDSHSPITPHSLAETRLWAGWKTEAEMHADELHRAAWHPITAARRRNKALYDRFCQRQRRSARSKDNGSEPMRTDENTDEDQHDPNSENQSQEKSGVVYEVLSGEFMAKAYCDGEHECERELEEVMNDKVTRQSDTEDENELATNDEDDGERETHDEDEDERGADDEYAGRYEYFIDGVGGFRMRRRRISRNLAEFEVGDEDDGDGIRRINVREYVRFFNSYIAGTAHRGGLGRDLVLGSSRC